MKRDDKKFCYVFKSAYGGLNAPDPGLVPDGAICGEEQVNWIPRFTNFVSSVFDRLL